MDSSERNQLIESHLPLVQRIAARWRGIMPMEDLVQVGVIGLMDAIDRWQPSQGKLATFAAWRIRGAIQDELRESGLIRLGRPSKNDGPSKRNALAFHAQAQFVEVGDPPGASEGPAAVDNSDELERLLRCLAEREREILQAHARGETMKSIGRRLGISESRVSQLHSRSLELVRESARNRTSMKEKKMAWEDCHNKENANPKRALAEFCAAILACEKAFVTKRPEDIGDLRPEFYFSLGILRACELALRDVPATVDGCRRVLNLIDQFHRWLGAPGDFGYGTKQGEALRWLYDSTLLLSPVVTADERTKPVESTTA